MVFRFRIILDAKDDIFRDIELEEELTFEDLHNAITQAFGFGGSEMASFYVSDDDWNQGEEIALFNVSEGLESTKIMSETNLSSLFSEEQKRMLYVYDFFNMWTFFVELIDIGEHVDGTSYPNLINSYGETPEDPPEKNFEAEPEEEDLNNDDLWNDIENVY